MVRTIDTAIHHADEIATAIAMANEFRGEEHVYYLSVAIANIHVLNNMLSSFQIIGVAAKGNANHTQSYGFSKDEVREMKKLSHRIMAQAIGWRDSVTRQGHEAQRKEGEA